MIIDTNNLNDLDLNDLKQINKELLKIHDKILEKNQQEKTRDRYYINLLDTYSKLYVYSLRTGKSEAVCNNLIKIIIKTLVDYYRLITDIQLIVINNDKLSDINKLTAEMLNSEMFSSNRIYRFSVTIHGILNLYIANKPQKLVNLNDILDDTLISNLENKLKNVLV